ncbi:hypothetical protein [Desulfogranum mediterraneum]|uniref:hypothetical protein n=1 Tax=Desulfogranum mediterraneum TaxID=160661 RepID=UPI0004235997|nr:hypothetical protein [Desulfogranum mediterraneum]
MSQWLIFLAIVPLSCFHLTKHYHLKNRWLWNGVSMGAVIAPVSFGLLKMTYIPLIGKLLGLVGLIANLTHGSVGYLCLLGTGVLELNTTITASQLVLINLLNGALFAACYGLIGYSIDKRITAEESGEPVMAA